MMLSYLFWILLFIVIYVYIGYTLLLIVLVGLKKLFIKNFKSDKSYEPEVAIFIAAYNEMDIIEEKVKNLRELDYPNGKLKFYWVTDGSNDGSVALLKKYPEMIVLHENERKGKIGAMNRGMKEIKSPITIYCDANSMLTKNSVKEIVYFFVNQEVGCVAGEKQIKKNQSDIAASSGEGFYWKYESFIKMLESEMGSTVGAAGELFAIRTELFREVETDTLLDDFVISLRIAENGFKLKYAPKAVAIESGSASIADELKRKVRIAAGGFQTLLRLQRLLNPFKCGFLAIEYWSHKVLRWTIVPISLLILLPLNVYLVFSTKCIIYSVLLILQFIFYFLALLGFVYRNKKTKLKLMFTPYYLIVMNVALILGFIKYTKGQQSVNWEKAKRM